MKDKINIALIDDHKLFRSGLKNLLESVPNFNVVAEAGNGVEFIDITDQHNIDIALVDIAMPKMDGVKATELVLEKHPNLQIIALSMFGEEAYYNQMVEAGARGFILKDSDIQVVEDGINTVYKGKTFFSQELLQALLNELTNDTGIERHDLSEREIEVIEHVCEGKSNIEIADDMCISKRTVEKHRANIMEKTHCKNTASLVIYAVKNKLYEIN